MSKEEVERRFESLKEAIHLEGCCVCQKLEAERDEARQAARYWFGFLAHDRPNQFDMLETSQHLPWLLQDKRA